MKLSQNQRVLRYLNQGRRLSALKAIRELRVARLAARVKDLRYAGHNIVTEMVTDGNVRYGIYYLSRAKPMKKPARG